MQSVSSYTLSPDFFNELLYGTYTGADTQGCRPHVKFSKYCLLFSKEVLPIFTPGAVPELLFPYIVHPLYTLRHFHPCQSNVCAIASLLLFSSSLSCHYFLLYVTVPEFIQPFSYRWAFSLFPICILDYILY